MIYMPAGIPAAASAASAATAAPSMLSRAATAAGSMAPTVMQLGQQEQALVNQLAKQGPPPQVQQPQGQQLSPVQNAFASMLPGNKNKMQMPVVPRLTRGEAATNPPSIGDALMRNY